MQSRQVDTLVINLARSGIKQIKDHIGNGGFTGTRFPYQSQSRAASHLEGNVVDRPETLFLTLLSADFELFNQVLYADDFFAQMFF